MSAAISEEAAPTSRALAPAAPDGQPGGHIAKPEVLVAVLTRQFTLARQQIARLEDENQRLGEQVECLQARNEELTRAAKRQAAPFSRTDGSAKEGNSRAPAKRAAGRKPGEAYGTKAHRTEPIHLDRIVEVDLPERCPRCEGAEIECQRIAHQYQAELPMICPEFIRFELPIGQCRECGARVQPRHAEQTSDALGAAASQIGPRAVALAALMNKQLGVSPKRIAEVYSQLGLEITPGGVSGAISRAGRRCEPTYEALVEGVAQSPTVAADETGWRVGGKKAWLWDFVGEDVTVYRIAKSRGFEVAASVLGEDFRGVLERDGWAPYRRFSEATHQSCLAHLLRRCRELLAEALAGGARIPHAVRRLLGGALALREERDSGTLGEEEFARRRKALDGEAERLLVRRPKVEANRRLLSHLRRERDALFTFLDVPGVEATNWRAEQGLRPGVVNRKSWGGNLTEAGARTQQVLTSVLRSASQQQRDPLALIVEVLRQPLPSVADLVIPGGARPSTTARAP
jgi:transposase